MSIEKCYKSAENNWQLLSALYKNTFLFFYDRNRENTLDKRTRRAGSAFLIEFMMMKLDKPAVSFASHTSATTLHGSPVMPT